MYYVQVVDREDATANSITLVETPEDAKKLAMSLAQKESRGSGKNLEDIQADLDSDGYCMFVGVCVSWGEVATPGDGKERSRQHRQLRGRIWRAIGKLAGKGGPEAAIDARSQVIDAMIAAMTPEQLRQVAATVQAKASSQR
jgi:hypothetical protein